MATTTTPLTTLASFKRSLQAGDAYELISNAWMQDGVWREDIESHKYGFVPRTAAKVQTNAVMWEGGSWFQFGKASDWTFDGDVASREDEYGRLTYRRVAS